MKTYIKPEAIEVGIDIDVLLTGSDPDKTHDSIGDGWYAKEHNDQWDFDDDEDGVE